MRYSLGQELDYVLSTKDGTSNEKFAQKFMHQNTECQVWMNGIDLATEIDRSHEGVVRFLYVGRLEHDKGILELLSVFNSLDHKIRGKYSLTIIGGGKLLKRVKLLAKSNSAVKVLGSVGHNMVQSYYRESDVFLSFNALGNNLANVVLEAVNYELAILTLREDKSIDRYKESNKFLGDNVRYLRSTNFIKDLELAILEFVMDNTTLHYYQQRSKIQLKPKLISWEKRLVTEVEVLKSLLVN
jgi:glycosyltransferase involved in cell wall biosynthesis